MTRTSGDSTAIHWHEPDNNVLELRDYGRVMARLTRWSDAATGEHAGWAVEDCHSGERRIVEHLSDACRVACELAGLPRILPPLDLLAEWPVPSAVGTGCAELSPDEDRLPHLLAELCG